MRKWAALRNEFRRAQITELVCEGLTNKEIASHLDITERLVKWYVAQLTHEQGFHGPGSRMKLLLLTLSRERKEECVKV